MTRGLAIFVAACAVVSALSILPPEHARWAALGLLVLLALTPAVGQSKPRRRAVNLMEGREASDSQ